MTEETVVKILEAIVEEAPHLIEPIERWIAGAKAKRVEEVRPATGHAAAAVADLRKGDPE